MDETTVQELAELASGYFVEKKRGDEDFWSLKKSHPAWVKEMVHEAHGDKMPNDYTYEFVVESLSAIEEHEDPEDVMMEADIYTSDRLLWLASGDRTQYVDTAVEEFGHSSEGVTGDIGLGQSQEKQEVYMSVLTFLQERADDLNED